MEGSALRGKRAVVTGSTRGLGFAFARELAEQGASVVINGRDARACAKAEAQLSASGTAVASVPGSVADEQVAEQLIATCVDRFGGVDLLVNNAGITRDRTLLKMSAEDFDEVVAVHLRGAWAASRSAARAMRAAGGSIVNIVSGSALYGLVGQCNYAAAKGGMLALTRALSLELRRYQIRVNAVYPTALTDMTRPLFELAAPGALDSWFRPPQDVAPLVAFLASDQSAQITGQVLAFDGRELTVWSHPEPVSAVRRDGPWNSGDMAAALLGEPSPLAALHPDQLGRHVHQALRPRARAAPGGSPGQRGE
jgi:3-oxoacyl-[acyl-carrier protein] reductase